MNIFMTFVAATASGIAVLLAAGGHDVRWVQTGTNSWRIYESGTTGPTVVFEAGAGSPLESWVLVQPAVSRFARTISYDRAGNGLSRRGGPPRDARQIALEFHSMLEHAAAKRPYILVGHSLGGPFIRMFADLYPEEVGGMVLVDPTQEALMAWAKAQDPDRASQSEAPRLDDEVGCAALTFSEVTNSRVSPRIPVILLSGAGPRHSPGFLSATMRHELEEDRDSTRTAKVKFHQAWVDELKQGQLIVTEESGHGIPWEEPNLIVQAIKEVCRRSERGR